MSDGVCSKQVVLKIGVNTLLKLNLMRSEKIQGPLLVIFVDNLERNYLRLQDKFIQKFG